MKTLIAVVALVALSGCANNFPFTNVGGTTEYEYIGCHKVDTPSTEGVYQFGPLGVHPRYVGNRVFFKQKSADGTVADTNLEKC